MADLPEQSETPNGSEEPDADFGVEGANPEIARRAERLRQAVDHAGGPKAVAARAGMPVGSLNNYRNGRDMKAEALVRLADACRVSLEWLAAGRGEPNFGWTVLTTHEQTADGRRPGKLSIAIGQRPQAEAGTVAPDPGESVAGGSKRGTTLFGTLDMTRMGEALKAAAQLFEDRGTVPSWRRLAQVAAIVYDAEDDPAETVRAQAVAKADD